MASGITLSAGVRQNLLSLQNTADLMSTTQNRLATGKKVNSALDNPVNFFTSSSLQSRSSDLSTLLELDVERHQDARGGRQRPHLDHRDAAVDEVDADPGAPGQVVPDRVLRDHRTAIAHAPAVGRRQSRFSGGAVRHHAGRTLDDRARPSADDHGQPTTDGDDCGDRRSPITQSTRSSIDVDSTITLPPTADNPRMRW